MALRSPTPFHNFWGATFAASTDLPNASGNPIGPTLNLEAGDFAYVTGDSTFYVCTSPGTPSGGNATWVQLTTGAATIDRFAPRYIVGGPTDSATAYDSGGFTYIPSNLNAAWQSDLQTALNTNAGDVHFRPGTFTLTGPITVPLAASVRGAGRTTIFSTTAAGDDTLGAFVLRAGSTLSDCAIAASAPANSTDATTLGVVYVYAGASPVPGTAHVENVYATYFLDPTSSVTACQSIYRVGALMGAQFSDCQNLLTGTLGGALFALCGWYAAASSTSLVISSSSHEGGDAGVVELGASLSASQISFTPDALQTFVGVGVYGAASSLANVVNSTIGVADGYCVNINNTNCVVGLSNNYLTSTDNALPAFFSTGSGRVVGNSINSSLNAVDTSGGTGHAIGFNLFVGNLSTAVSDEVAHNI
jgi:hypothetical protein